MQTTLAEASVKVKKVPNGLTGVMLSGGSKKVQNGSTGAMLPGGSKNIIIDPVVISSDDEDGPHNEMDEDNQSCENASKQLVLYEPEPIQSQPPPSKGSTSSGLPPRVLPSVGAFTVQCAKCFKWRLIPTKEKYEEIRECILEQPFVCDTAREWQPNISCDDPADIQQDGSRLWAIDKPSIAQPPPGWERELRIRGEGGSKFADVYYIAPTGKRLRSMVEVQKYLFEHPELTREGVALSQFSFQIPKPLQENYVRKRPSRVAALSDESNFHGARAIEPPEVRPLAWTGPNDATVLRIGRAEHSSFLDVDSPGGRRAEKRARQLPFKEMYSSAMFGNQHHIQMQEHFRSRNGGL